MPDIQQFLHKLSIYAVPVVLAITFHEAAHGYVAFRKGDPTAKMLGRVTLNPIPHIDPFGTILLPAMMILLNTGVVFGWARPVPVNFRLLHDQKRDPIYVAAAGVVTNLGLALLSGLIFRALIAFDPALMIETMMHGGGPTADTPARMVTVPLSLMCVVSVQFNCLLALFNLIPIPPLDGGRIAVGLLPPRASMALASVERYGTLLVLLLLMFGPAGVIWRFVDILASFILGA
ncbi:MAG: putative rane-associated zinc metalloprotease [Deltaproteobacteria bacterium]|nr:putative rane-associated zinc metalloprotease [Deltaproteobacteria bacterium]